MKAFIRFILSLKTAAGMFLAFIALDFIGSLSLVRNLAFFSGIDETPLFRWLADAGNFKITWWLLLMIGLLALLAVSTIFCTVEALLKKMERKHLLLKLSPQIMHLGVLFIMLGHLLTASLGFKMDMTLKKDEEKRIGDSGVILRDVSVQTDAYGYDADWQAALQWVEAGRHSPAETLKPVNPRYFGRYGLYLKSVSLEPVPTALIRVCRDPGALWALFGGILLCSGGIGFVYARSRE